MKLNTIRDNQGATFARKRVGRGIGSGLGKTSGHGQKGQKARSGVAIKGFEGGQMPIQMRVPKRGFKRAFVRGPEGTLVNLKSIQDAIEAKKLNPSEVITKALLVEAGLIRTVAGSLKLLAKGELKTKITIEVDQASKAAQVFVEKLGGEVKLPAAQA